MSIESRLSDLVIQRWSLGERVRQYETAYVAIQSSEHELKPGTAHAWSFFAQFESDHPAASSAADAAVLRRLLSSMVFLQCMFCAIIAPRRPRVRQRSAGNRVGDLEGSARRRCSRGGPGDPHLDQRKDTR